MFRFIVASLFLTLLTVSVQAKTLDPFEAKNAPVIDFVDWVSKSSGNNIITGRGVSGFITVHVKNLDSSDLMPFFKKVMSANGYLVTHDSNVYRVTIDSDKLSKATPLAAKIYRFKNVRNTKLRDSISSILSSSKLDNEEPSKGNVAFSNHSVDILPSSNSLLVIATQDQINSLDLFHEKVDLAAKQVLIEAVILETDLSESESLGVNLSTALSSNGFSLISNTFSIPTDLTSSKMGGHIIYSSGGDVRALVQAVSQNSNIKILSTPNILVMDREEGHISVGQNVPFLLSSSVTDGGTSVQQIKREDVGVSLTVTPHVLDSGRIVLKIHQESSSVTSSTQALDIITNKRSISTVAQINNGETISLGGLISDEIRINNSGVPVLKSIPWLGRLFRYESKDSVQRELTVLIKTILI